MAEGTASRVNQSRLYLRTALVKSTLDAAQNRQEYAREEYEILRRLSSRDEDAGSLDRQEVSEEPNTTQAVEDENCSQPDSTVESTEPDTTREPEPPPQNLPPGPHGLLKYFRPCTATDSFFLYAHGSNIVCCHHNTLIIQRVFSGHSEDISLLVADNEAKDHRGRRVLSYDQGRTAIIWEIATGRTLARFRPYDDLTSAAWMQNYSLVAGTASGDLLLYQASTSDYVRLEIGDVPITALAPFPDCKTIAFGRQDGTLVVAALIPEFKVLHDISRDSQIMCLALHNSSRTQSHMLAVQDENGEPRLYAIRQDHDGDANLIRLLKTSNNGSPAPRWIGWSKNGRIVRYVDSETLLADVRTKHVTYEHVATPEDIQGLAVYGRQGAFFTLDAGNTIQQFNLVSPLLEISAAVTHRIRDLRHSPSINKAAPRGSDEDLEDHKRLSSLVRNASNPWRIESFVLEDNGPDETLSSDDTDTVVTVEEIPIKVHECDKGQKCRKFRRQKRMLEQKTALLCSMKPESEPLETRSPVPQQDESTDTAGPDQESDNVRFLPKVKIDDTCETVLPAALARYQITDDPHLYRLWVVFGDEERLLSTEEKPLVIFKELDKSGKKPMFMLRKVAAHNTAAGKDGDQESEHEATSTPTRPIDDVKIVEEVEQVGDHESNHEPEGSELSSPSDQDPDDASTVPSVPFLSDGPGSTAETSTLPDTVSRQGDTNDAAQRAEWLLFYNYAKDGSESLTGDDVASLYSLNDDIASLAETTTTTTESREAAANFLVKKLTDDNDLLRLYQEAVRRISEARFVRNHRRLLKRLFLDLRSKEQNPIEKAAIRFLRLRSERSRISAIIYRSVMPLEAQTRERIQMKIGQEKDSLFLLDRLLGEQNPAVMDSNVTGKPPEDPVIYDDGDVLSELSEEEELEFDEDPVKEKLPNLESVSEFLTKGTPFDSYKTNLEKFLRSKQDTPAVTEATILTTALDIPTSNEVPRDLFKTVEDRFDLKDDATRTLTEMEISKSKYNLFSLPRWLRYERWTMVRKLLRPKLRQGFRRIEWRCDCGVDLYADFSDHNPKALDDLERSLKSVPSSSHPIDPHAPAFHKRMDHVFDAKVSAVFPGSIASRKPRNPWTRRLSDIMEDQQLMDDDSGPCPATGDQAISNSQSTGTSDNKASSDKPIDGTSKGDLQKSISNVSTSSSTTLFQPNNSDSAYKFLALCVNTGGIYKTLAEIDTTGITSDREGFLRLKEEYVKVRDFRSKFSFLIKPITLEFVQFTLWSLRAGYVSICNRPESIPPHTACEYEYTPKPLDPLPPMPPEIFIHYLEHGDKDLHPSRHVWFPRLPMRKDRRVIDGVEPAYGWGIHVIEGPNREVIFWIIIASISASLLAGILWGSLAKDIQGGTGLGAFSMALPPALLAAFLFRLGGI